MEVPEPIFDPTMGGSFTGLVTTKFPLVPLQMVIGLTIGGVGAGFTVTECVAVAVHEPGLVTVTVYMVVIVGLTEMDCVVSVVLHNQEVPVPPVSLSVTACLLYTFQACANSIGYVNINRKSSPYLNYIR